jgi:hypothetical protein
MAALHNRVSRKELKERIKKDPTPRITISFYCYFKIEDPAQFRNDLYRHLKELGVLGVEFSLINEKEKLSNLLEHSPMTYFRANRRVLPHDIE